MNRARRLALGVLTTVALTAIPSAVSAQDLGHLDKLHDVMVYNPSDGIGPNFAVPAPGRTIGDITGMHVSNTSAALHVAVYFRGLPQPQGLDQFQFTLLTPRVGAELWIQAKPGNLRGTAAFNKASGTVITCVGLRYAVDYTHRRVWITIPSSCIARPTWVRVGMRVLISTHPDDVSTNHRYVDDALTSRNVDDYAPPAMSAKVYR